MIGVARANTRFVPPVVVMDIGIRSKARQSNRITKYAISGFVVGRWRAELLLQLRQQFSPDLQPGTAGAYVSPERCEFTRPGGGTKA